MNCPKCDADMEMMEYDPSVGIMSSYWVCTSCDETVLADLPDYEDWDR